jgi:hypothetical protein
MKTIDSLPQGKRIAPPDEQVVRALVIRQIESEQLVQRYKRSDG